MFEVSLRNAKTLIEMGIENNQSVYLKGSPGIGKSSIVKSTAKEKGLNIMIFEGSSLDPTDIRGILVPDKERSYFTKSPMLPDTAKHGDKGILLIDELASSMPSTKVALQPIFHPDDRRLGEHKLPDGWIPMATGNLMTDGAGATQDSEAMKDRVLVLNVSLSFQDWKEDYAYSRNLHPIAIGFLNFRPDMFNTFDKRNKNETGKGFVTARTWERISETLYYAEKTKMPDTVLTAALAGWGGEGVATEVIVFRKIYTELPDPREIFKGKDIIPKEPSVLFAFCSAIIAYLKEQPNTQRAVDRMLEYSLKLDAEFGGLLIRDSYIKYRDPILKSKHWATVGRRYNNGIQLGNGR